MALRRVSSSFFNNAIQSPRTCHRIVPFSTNNKNSIRPIDQIVDPYVKSLEAEGFTPRQARTLITTCTKFSRDSKAEMNVSGMDLLHSEFKMHTERLSADLDHILSRLILDEVAKRKANSAVSVKKVEDLMEDFSIKIMETETKWLKSIIITLVTSMCFSIVVFL